MDNYFIKNEVKRHEYDIHKYIYDNFNKYKNIINVPEIVSYDEDKHIMIMEKIENDNISNIYGDNLHNVPKNIINKIRKIIAILYLNKIIYPDITGYNFIKTGNKIWIIDFEHTYIEKSNDIKNIFVKEFIDGIDKWNPDFE